MDPKQQKEIAEAVKVLKEGGIVIFPTDTAFGIGCRMDNEKSVKRLYKLRKRAETQASPVLVGSVEMAKSYLRSIPPDVMEKLILPYWPGALTIVLHCQENKVPALVRGGTNTLGVRMPDHPALLEIIKELWVPILGPSANFQGDKTPYAFEDLNPDLMKKVDFVMHGVCTIKQTSTVVDCTITPWNILRQGAVELS